MSTTKAPTPYPAPQPTTSVKAAIFVSESVYQQAVDNVIAQLEDQLEQAFQRDAPFDYESQSGILTVDCGVGGKIIINRQAPLQEIWVAARAGGFHFRKADDGWRDTRSNELLEELLGRVLLEQSGVDLELSL
jgi:CyaY protein